MEIVLFLDTLEDKQDDKPTKRALPSSVQSLGMTEDEYKYLVMRAIKTFDIPDPVI